MPRRQSNNRAARAGLSRGLEARRLRRNSAKQALSRLEIGAGLELDSRSRLTTSNPNRMGSAASGSSLLSPLKDNTNALPSDFRVSQVTSTTSPVTTLAALQVEVEVALEEIRANFATLTRRLNEIAQRMP